MSEPITVKVEFDPSLHPSVNFDELDAESKIAFAALDTAYNLLRESAVRVVLMSIRTEAAKQGTPITVTDEELFKLAEESGVEGVPTSYRDLAPNVELAALSLHSAFELLVEAAAVEAEEGLALGASLADGE